MTKNQFRTALDRLGLSQVEAARIFGYDDRSVRRWAIGERSVPPAVGILMRLMLDGKIDTDDVAAACKASA